MMTTRIIEKPDASSARTSIAIAAFFCLFVLAPPALAATTDHSSCDLGDYRPSVRPNPDGAPTLVSLVLTLADLIAISDSDQVVKMDVLLTIEWSDHRLQPFSLRWRFFQPVEPEPLSV